MISVRNPSGALVGIQPMFRNAAGALVAVTIAVRDPGGTVVVPQPPVAAITASASPSTVTGAISRPLGGLAQTNETTVTVNGGTAPFSYAWVSEDGAMDAVSPTAATTRFSQYLDAGESSSDTFACTVTDAKGQTANVEVSASVSNYGRQNNAPL